MQGGAGIYIGAATGNWAPLSVTVAGEGWAGALNFISGGKTKPIGELMSDLMERGLTGNKTALSCK